MQFFNVALLLVATFAGANAAYKMDDEVQGLLVADNTVTKLCQSLLNVYGVSQRACFAFAEGTIVDQIKSHSGDWSGWTNSQANSR